MSTISKYNSVQEFSKYLVDITVVVRPGVARANKKKKNHGQLIDGTLIANMLIWF